MKVVRFVQLSALLLLVSVQASFAGWAGIEVFGYRVIGFGWGSTAPQAASAILAGTKALLLGGGAVAGAAGGYLYKKYVDYSNAALLERGRQMGAAGVGPALVPGLAYHAAAPAPVVAPVAAPAPALALVAVPAGLPPAAGDAGR